MGNVKQIPTDSLIVELPSTLQEILLKIERNGLGLIFLVNQHRVLLGTISDGDIRRAILTHSDLSEHVTETSLIFNHNARWLPVDCLLEDIWKLHQEGISCIPLLDEKKCIVDFSTPNRVRRFPVSEPVVGEQETINVMDCLAGGWISSQGKYIAQFENEFSDYLGGGISVAVSNGTTALHLGLVALGIGVGDEVIVPDFTFGASVNAIIHAGATPRLVDVDLETWTVDLSKLREAIGPKTKAIMPVHIYGQPSRMDEILSLARAFNLLVIEDCAESLGATYKNELVGLQGDCACFSFFANKIITTGEGGMVVFKSKEIASKAKILRDHGMSLEKKYWHDYAGFNFRMTNMQAAIGVAQLERINIFLEKRKEIFEKYDDAFVQHPHVEVFQKNSWSTRSCWLYTILLKDMQESARNALIEKLANRGIESRPGFYPMHLMAPFKDFSSGDYPNSVSISERSISLPSSVTLSDIDIEHIAGIVLEELEQLND